ncbi:MAG: ATP-binding cassette domain-containing protein [Oscillospiraceae bacterium]|nr:ATP-binding cassette domain-containing protein [Oscillospiraceae bacterium]
MLELKHISFEVPADNATLGILKDVSLSVEDGKILVITGPNGGGKSTLARIIMGLEKPTAGQIIFDGKDITGLSISERAKLGVGYAFQQPPRFKGMTVRQLLKLARGSALTECECCNLLSKVGLCGKDYMDREVDGSLSGGEVKRIEIATLMARKLKLAIYDEPEAGIDLWSFSMLVDSFRDISCRNNESVILISHQERIMELADDMAVIADGQVQRYGTKADVLPYLMQDFNETCRFKRSRQEVDGPC